LPLVANTIQHEKFEHQDVANTMENERFERQNVEMAASSSNMLQFQGKRAEEHIQKKQKNIIPKTIPDPFL
jgi:hypothetical protein